jgi:(E)-4-hydroxy-3-methylbut-2-enyl-diphosphate synthase
LNFVILLKSDRPNPYLDLRRAFQVLDENEIPIPVILTNSYANLGLEDAQLNASTDLGGLFVDGFGDGIMISGESNYKEINSLAFGILQAARTRISKTEYISCPSCGRTLFDLQETTALIRKRTDHLKGVKIGIMGCIVNGPGEMADADYGYVGVGKGKINLYKEKTVVKKNVAEDDAVDELINLIKEYGDWVDEKLSEN